MKNHMPISVWGLIVLAYLVLCIAYASALHKNESKILPSITAIAQGLVLILFTPSFGASTIFGLAGVVLTGGGLVVAINQLIGQSDKKFQVPDDTIFLPQTTPKQAEAILETSPIPAVLTEQGDLVVASNQKMADLLGKSKAGMAGKSFTSMLPPFEDGVKFLCNGEKWTPSVTRKGGQTVTFLAPDVTIYEQKIEMFDIMDPATSLYNAAYLKRRGLEELEGCRRYKRRLTAILLKIEFPKMTFAMNEETFDSACTAFGGMVAKQIRNCDSGFLMPQQDEFLVLLPDTPPTGAKTALSRIEAGVKKLASIDQLMLKDVMIKTGTASYFGEDATDVEGLLKDVYISLARSQQQ